MSEEIGRGLVIVLVGMAGTFAVLTVIMSVISLNGRIFGKKKKTATAPKAAGEPPAS